MVVNDFSHFVHLSLAPVCLIICLAKQYLIAVLYSHCAHSRILGCLCKVWLSKRRLVLNEASQFLHLNVVWISCFARCFIKLLLAICLCAQCIHSYILLEIVPLKLGCIFKIWPKSDRSVLNDVLQYETNAIDPTCFLTK
ncbi:unnamed protein product [Acanthoscelides obtectus]|uniref:Uncharacterized protein n=1 Tax=Acanthoscelides obtectus TaxID=200917 RepID=A0A9P0MEY3_ACAOB|nr:unnamed protein product [Acanthoscelides obtectus]CAH2011320.1 unnamed protein product [Acanthoscelides obtectus]CAK1670570.1 hypothetical protein AOBTE_LOCUS27681 [Acanthoscelides obtectus]CAK1670576.1 hypothetical protein AOBTE_LOCUS27686 [Acanthoscelides obtectus]